MASEWTKNLRASEWPSNHLIPVEVTKKLHVEMGMSQGPVTWSSKLSQRIDLQSILITHELYICEFSYSLKFICDLKINTCVIFTIIHRHVQSGEKFEPLHVHIPSHCWTRQYCPFSYCKLNALFTVYLVPQFLHFCYLLVISLFKRLHMLSAKCFLVSISTGTLWYALERKYMC